MTEVSSISSESGSAHSALSPEPERKRFHARRAIGVVLFLAAAGYGIFGASAFNQYEASLIVVYAIAGLGQDWLTGRAGQVSLGAAALMAVGAFVTARLSQTSWAAFPLPILISAVCGGLVGILVGLTGLRFRGLYLALSTLALQFIVAFAAQQYQGTNAAGLSVSIPHLGSLQFGQGRNLLAMTIVVFALVALALSGLYRRAPGRVWAAIRQNEDAAAVAGVDVRRWKLVAFVGSSAVIAVAGSMYAYVIGIVSYVPFSLDLAVSILVVVFVGGLGSISGMLIGAVFVVLLPYWLQTLAGRLPLSGSVGSWLSTYSPELAVAIYGLALLVVLLFERHGVVGIIRRALAVVSRHLIRRPAAAGRTN